MNKTSFFTLLIGLAIVVVSCGKKNEQKIIGRWKIDDITTPEPNFSKMPDSLVTYYKNQLQIQNTLILATGFYEFLEGGKCFFELDKEKFEGKWRLSDDQQKLFTKEKNGTTEEEFEIKDLTESVFTIESTVDGKMRRLVMKKEIK